MNEDNILLLADTIENSAIPGLGFNMYSFLSWTQFPAELDLSGHNCGTIACIGGWANAIRLKYEPTAEIDTDAMADMHDWKGAREWLGLEQHAGDALFAPVYPHYNLITPQVAASVLRRLAETGKVLWPTTEELEHAQSEEA